MTRGTIMHAARRWALVGALLLSLFGWAAEPAPPWKRLLQGADARKAELLEKQIARGTTEGKWAEARKAANDLVALRQQKQGKDHWETVNARWLADTLKTVAESSSEKQRQYAGIQPLPARADALEIAGKHADALLLRQRVLAVCRDILGDRHPFTAVSHINLASHQVRRGKHAAAEASCRKALAIQLEVLGEEHPETATCLNNLGTSCQGQGKHAEAERHFRKALAIRRNLLGEEHAHTAQTWLNLAISQESQFRYAEAEPCFRKALAIRRKLLGEEHADTATSHLGLALNLHAQARYGPAEAACRQALAIYRKARGEESLPTAHAYLSLAAIQDAQGQYANAEVGNRKALAIRRKLLGEEHPHTADCYGNLASCLTNQARHTEAESANRKALAIRRKVLGEEHPETVMSLNNLAASLHAQGKYGEAEAGFREALAIRRKLFGEEHPATASSYNDLSGNLSAQGKHAEAEAGFRKALVIRRKLLGEEHADTAHGYVNLATCLNDQGRYAEAEAGLLQALAINKKVLGAKHPETARSHNNLAANQIAQGKFVEAEASCRQALAICVEVLGEHHPHTATCWNNLASNLKGQRRYADAEESSRKALAIFRKALGEDHPLTANTRGNLGVYQREQGKYAEAEETLRQALASNRKTVGEEHPRTFRNYYHLALNQRARGKYADAEELATKASDLFTRIRLRIAATGLARAAVTSQRSPLPLLAALLARNGKYAAAWQRLEESLGRGTGDDLAARLKRPAAERQRQAELVAQLRLLDAQLQRLAGIRKPTAAHKEQREQLLLRQLRTQDALVKFSRELEEKYGPVAGQVLDVAAVQKALPADGAYLAWLDLEGEHWAVLLKARGGPAWVRLPGSGPGRAWVKADDELPRKVRDALVSADGDVQPLARKLRVQRLAPLADHLEGIRQLIVLPSAEMDGVPVEVIAEGFTVSYALSASLFAHQKEQPRSKNSGLVALGDPVFRGPDQSALPLPPGGLLVTVVVPRSPGALAGLKSGDVLLRYDDTALEAVTDLRKAIAAAGRVGSVKVWRLPPGATKAKELTLRVQSGKLGVLLAPQPARRALLAQRRSDALLAARDGTDWQPLPGTRYEVSALKKLFAGDRPTVLLDSDASETRLAELAKDGTLGRARFVHLATHGQARADRPLASRIILARDRLAEGQRGELSAEQVLTGWELRAELVTLSACQTGLGKHERGEGFVGFAQALHLTGARSVCLSRWSVNDLSTALLMERFYQNLLGKRPGLKAPLGKAAALAEAKQWLRTLPRAAALKRAEAIGAGVERAPGAKELPRVKVPSGPKDEPPYAHPYYWAGFVLVGDRS